MFTLQKLKFLKCNENEQAVKLIVKMIDWV